MSRSWTEGDRQRFRDRDVLRAQTISGKRRQGPTTDEWADEIDTQATRRRL